MLLTSSITYELIVNLESLTTMALSTMRRHKTLNIKSPDYVVVLLRYQSHKQQNVKQSTVRLCGFHETDEISPESYKA